MIGPKYAGAQKLYASLNISFNYIYEFQSAMMKDEYTDRDNTWTFNFMELANVCNGINDMGNWRRINPRTP